MMTSAQRLGLDDNHLQSCGDPHRLSPETIAAFERMQSAAMQDGLDMQIASSYRDFQRQLAIWNAKWSGQRALLDINENSLDSAKLSDLEKLHAILLWSALPGASRHHWGTDLDVYDKVGVESSGNPLQLTQSEYSAGGPCHNLAVWLQQNAAMYGFHLPYATYNGGVAAEPWHISYAKQGETVVDIEALRELLSSSPIEGKQVILDNLENIVNRYTYNEGTL